MDNQIKKQDTAMIEEEKNKEPPSERGVKTTISEQSETPSYLGFDASSTLIKDLRPAALAKVTPKWREIWSIPPNVEPKVNMTEFGKLYKEAIQRLSFATCLLHYKYQLAKAAMNQGCLSLDHFIDFIEWRYSKIKKGEPAEEHTIELFEVEHPEDVFIWEEEDHAKVGTEEVAGMKAGMTMNPQGEK